MIKNTIILVSIVLIIATLSLARAKTQYSQVVLYKSAVIPISVDQPTGKEHTGECNYDDVKKLVKCYVPNEKGTHVVFMRYTTKVTLPDHSYAIITIACPLEPDDNSYSYTIPVSCNFTAEGTYNQKYALHYRGVKKARFDVNFKPK